jgi:hypothetical protein
MRYFPTATRRESTLSTTSQVSQPPGVYPQQMLDDVQNPNMYRPYSYPVSPTQAGVGASSQEPMQVDSARGASAQNPSAQAYGNNTYTHSPPAPQPPQMPQPPQSDDLRYWNNMFRDLGFGDTIDQSYAAQHMSSVPAQQSQQSQQSPVPHHQSYGNGRGAGNHQQPYPYHHMHSNAPGYGL